MCKYYIVISDTRVGFFLNVLYLLLAVILSELYEKPRRKKDWVREKSTKKNLCERHHCFDCTPSLLCHFLLFSLSTLLPKWHTCCMTPTKIHNISMGGILCDMENMKITCNLILAGWHLWERVILDFFDFSYSGYDLKLIIKTHTLNCYLFSLKFLLKTKTCCR